MTPIPQIRVASRIQGFMAPFELQWLARQAQSRALTAEIGSWRGRSTRALADNTSGLVFAIDPWLPTPPLRHFTDSQPPGWLYHEFRENLRDLKNIVCMKMDSLSAAKVLAGLRFDMIFIDGDHSYSACRSDILAWRPLLVPGGLLCGHDYDTADGVRQAVDELLGETDHPAGFIWAARPTEAAS